MLPLQMIEQLYELWLAQLRPAFWSEGRPKRPLVTSVSSMVVDMQQKHNRGGKECIMRLKDHSRDALQVGSMEKGWTAALRLSPCC